MTDTLSVLRHSHARMSKHWNADGTLTPYDEAKHFTLTERQVCGIGDLSELLTELEDDPHAFIIRGKWVGPSRAAEQDAANYKPGKVRRALAQFVDQPLHTVLVDVDRFEPISCDPVEMPEVAITEFIESCLPVAFWSRSLHWQLSSSAGAPETAGVLKAHLWFWLETPQDCDALTAWAKSVPGVDVALFRVVQVHYTALPTFAPGVADPVAMRSGFIEGLAGDAVPLVIDRAALAAAGFGAVGSSTQRHVVLRGVVSADPVAQALADAGLIKSQLRGGELNIECPFVDKHTGGAGGAETSTQYFPAHTHGYAKGNFKCMHAHCQDRRRIDWLAVLGLDADGRPLGSEADDFDAVPDDAGDTVGGAGGAVGVGARSGGGNADAPRMGDDGLGTVPDAKHLCTDQANANRLVARFKGRALVAGGEWYYWDGTRWKAGERGVYTNACELSKIVKQEAAEWRVKTADDGPDGARNLKIAEALDKWSAKCEMRATIESAIALVKKTISVDVGELDRDPWLLNVANGTVDLRTGVLRPHRPADFITKVSRVRYVAGARSVEWQRVLSQITLEQGHWGDTGGPLFAFLQRWFGYCATGLVREQVFVVHHGDGSNGKSTVLDVMAAVLGDYASGAAPGLLSASRGERHPTEIADLAGKRMVTAHETGEGCVLREDFIKQATGGDVLKARVMRGDFFDFKPTHKLQLLTNHKPVIKGQDGGIWRRVLLVPYLARFGSSAALAAGDAHFLKDVDVMGKLLGAEALEGVLAWVVAGAVAWAAEGLQAPESVLSASRSYQSEQDRVGTFLRECCEFGAEYHEPLTSSMGGGLYSGYVGWCKESGIFALSKQRLLQELERAVPGFAKREEKLTFGSKRRAVTMLYGLRFMPDE
jgi:putative DNA primase/helicase